MKKIILISLFGLMFSQAKMETRVYEIEGYFTQENWYEFPLNDITNHNLNEAIVSVLLADFDYLPNYNYNQVKLANTDDFNMGNEIVVYVFPNNGQQISSYGALFMTNSNNILKVSWNSSDDGAVNSQNISLKIAITAEFPDMDTGYIEEGFDFCLVPGNNLVAFPCDNPVSVETAIPELAQAEIEQIIGAGQAATNLNGQFIGSLSNFTPGAGYWFKSSSSMCFNYACAE